MHGGVDSARPIAPPVLAALSAVNFPRRNL